MINTYILYVAITYVCIASYIPLGTRYPEKLCGESSIKQKLALYTYVRIYQKYYNELMVILFYYEVHIAS